MVVKEPSIFDKLVKADHNIRERNLRHRMDEQWQEVERPRRARTEPDTNANDVTINIGLNDLRNAEEVLALLQQIDNEQRNVDNEYDMNIKTLHEQIYRLQLLFLLITCCLGVLNKQLGAALMQPFDYITMALYNLWKSNQTFRDISNALLLWGFLIGCWYKILAFFDVKLDALRKDLRFAFVVSSITCINSFTILNFDEMNPVVELLHRCWHIDKADGQHRLAAIFFVGCLQIQRSILRKYTPFRWFPIPVPSLSFMGDIENPRANSLRGVLEELNIHNSSLARKFLQSWVVTMGIILGIAISLCWVFVFPTCWFHGLDYISEHGGYCATPSARSILSTFSRY